MSTNMDAGVQGEPCAAVRRVHVPGRPREERVNTPFFVFLLSVVKILVRICVFLLSVVHIIEGHIGVMNARA